MAKCTNITVCDDGIRGKITEPLFKSTIVENVLKVKMTEVISIAGTSSVACSGGVFITNISPVNPSDVVVVDWIVDPSGKQIVKSISTDTTSVRVDVEWDGDGPNWSGECFINDILVINPTEISSTRRFQGSVILDISGLTEIKAEHECGASHEIEIDLQGSGPIITSVIFVNGYPGTQTEVKENDTFDVEVNFDPSGSKASHVEVIGFGCAKSDLFDLSSTELDWGTTHRATVTITIAHTGLVPSLLPVQIRGRNSFGTFGPVVDSSAGGSINGTHVVLCSDLTPSFVDHSTTFPLGQLAFKGSESGTQSTEIHNFTFAVYSNPLNQFIIANPNTYELDKTITCTSPGGYNDNSTNFSILATRIENDTEAIFNKNIEVADVAPLVTVTQPQTRLRSSVTGESYLITASSNQNLASSPLLALDVPVSGTWQGAGFIGSLKNWTRSILITDGGDKGIASWSFLSTPTNRAGIEANITGDQNVGGFLPRTLTISAWPNREVDIGTRVTNISKIQSENLSKGGDGPNGGTNFLYDPTTDNEADKFTICDPSSTANPNGYLWYNKDQPNAVSNTSGTAQVIIWETV